MKSIIEGLGEDAKKTPRSIGGTSRSLPLLWPNLPAKASESLPGAAFGPAQAGFNLY